MLNRTLCGVSRTQLSYYGSQTATKQHHAKSETGPSTPIISVENAGNGAVVAAMDHPINCSIPIARISALFRAGSRYEDYNTRGLTHLLRRSSALATSDFSALGLTRNLQQIGASFQCTSTREHMIYSIDAPLESIEEAAKFLANAATKPMFYHWELKDQVYPIMKYDLELLHRRQFETLTFELLHEAAFRSGLKNSLFAPTHKVGSHTLEMIENHLTNYYSSNHLALVGTGVDVKLLKHLAEHLFHFRPSKAVEGSASKKSASVSEGKGEMRKDLPIDYAHVALATECDASVGSKSATAFAVLTRILGVVPNRVQHGSSAGAGKPLLNKATIDDDAGGSSQAVAFAFNFSDTGLFGVHVVGPYQTIGKSLRAARQTILEVGKSGVNDADLKRAKTQLKSELLMQSECPRSCLDDLGVELSLTGKSAGVEAALKSVDAVTLDEVNQAAKKLLKGRQALAAVGNLENVPYIEEL